MQPHYSLKKRIYCVICCVFVFHLVALAWIFFRARDLPSARRYLRGLIRFSSERTFPFSFDQLAWMTVSIVVLLLLIDLPQYLARNHTVLLRWPLLLRVTAICTLLLFLLLNRGNQDVAFIYFQF